MAGRSVLVVNSGSSSIKYALYDFAKAAATCILQGSVEGIGASKGSISHKNLQTSEDIEIEKPLVDHGAGFKEVTGLLQDPENVSAVGHRIVHGGERFHRPAHITEDVKQAIQAAIPLAPLHNPANLTGVNFAESIFKCPHVAVFDTAFHSTIPRHAYMYALPYRFYEELGVRRYGFHGTSYQFVLQKAAKLLDKPKEEVNIIALHIGAGASMCAIKGGKSVDTTMGITPLEGLVMATRSGDVDPALWSFLAAHPKGLKYDKIDAMLNKESGWYGLSGDKDMRVVLKGAAAGSDRHSLALDVFVHRIRKYLGSYLVQLEGKVDAVVFTAGVAERSAVVRSRICQGLESFGIALDEAKNSQSNTEVHKDGSKVKLLVIPTDEQLCIAQQTLETLESLQVTA